MQKSIKFENSGEIRDFKEYSDNKLAIAKVCVLSTAPNSHQLNISEEVLRRDIGSIRGNFLVADMVMGEATTHTPLEAPVGYFLPNEEIEFEEVDTDEGKVVKAWAYAVLSKQYAKSAYEMFVNDNHRATSIEMTVVVDEGDENKVVSFDAFGSTILGKTVTPSCKDAEISLVRFAKEANSFYGEHKDKLSVLKQFVKEREQMAEKKTYKIDKSKEAMSDADWSNIDKSALRDKIMGAENRFALVKATYMLIEEGWEDAPSEKLKYPVMAFNGNTLVYYHRALSSALAYAKQNNETAVVNKIEKIYKTLDLSDNDSGKEEKNKMEEKFEIEGRKAWAEVIEKVQEHEGDDVYVDSIEDNFIIYTKNNERYKVKADISVSKDDEKIEADIKWDTVQKDAVQEMKEDNKMESVMSEIEQRDNIIMEKDSLIESLNAELEELRQFKAGIEKEKQAAFVESVMSELKDFMDCDKYKEFREEGLSCSANEMDAWANKAKAFCFEKGKSLKKEPSGMWTFSAPKTFEDINKRSSIWEQL